MTLRLLAVIAFLIAIIFFVVALIVNPTTDATSVAHYQDIGFIAVAAGLGLFALEGVDLPRRPPNG